MRLFEKGMTLEQYQSVIFESEVALDKERFANDTSDPSMRALMTAYEDGYDLGQDMCDYSRYPLVGPEDATPEGIVALIMLFVGDSIVKDGNRRYDDREYLVMANGYATDMREPELEFDRLADWITGYSYDGTVSAVEYDLGEEHRGEEQVTRDTEFLVALDDIDLDELRKEWRRVNHDAFACQMEGITNYLRSGIREIMSAHEKAIEVFYDLMEQPPKIEILVGGKPLDQHIPYELAYDVIGDICGHCAAFYDFMDHDFDGLGRECYDALLAE